MKKKAIISEKYYSNEKLAQKTERHTKDKRQSRRPFLHNHFSKKVFFMLFIQLQFCKDLLELSTVIVAEE